MDTQLDHWGEEAENEIDDFLYNVAAKARLLTKLPVLPFTAGSVPESVQGAADHLVEGKYFAYIKNLDLAKHHQEAAEAKLQAYFDKLKTDKIMYGRILR
jgi:hypothetical protein